MREQKNNKSKQANDQQDDDFFGNRKDYTPKGGDGLGGHYREPSSGGSWNYHRKKKQSQRHRRQLQLHEQQHQRQTHAHEDPHGDVLSTHQPGWQERIGQSEQEAARLNSGILTIRQQEGQSSESLHWNKKTESLRSHQTTQRPQDASAVWNNFMDDLRRNRRVGQNDDRKSRNNQRKNKRNNNQKRNRNGAQQKKK
ncbi:MAG: hypothetical protein CL920_16860 [Deltaproteobacteria bacterium]|nr:hypothetical protein [Deltaproteobacteria bacterium]MBU50352.1 hypothetical protein [Deltaproteobacteria bacterium]|tara:strand:- start:927 stop:1517 length:591 start_codon:yes stop_codon:yes gene_type:complete